VPASNTGKSAREKRARETSQLHISSANCNTKTKHAFKPYVGTTAFDIIYARADPSTIVHCDIFNVYASFSFNNFTTIHHGIFFPLDSYGRTYTALLCSQTRTKINGARSMKNVRMTNSFKHSKRKIAMIIVVREEKCNGTLLFFIFFKYFFPRIRTIRR
jgi:hypothetical protein